MGGWVGRRGRNTMIALLSRGAYYSAARTPKTDWYGLGRSCTNISYSVGVHRASVHYPNLKIWVVAKMLPKSSRRWRPCRFAPSSVQVTSFPIRNGEKWTSGLKSESNLHMCSSIALEDPVRSRSTVWEEFSPNGPRAGRAWWWWWLWWWWWWCVRVHTDEMGGARVCGVCGWWWWR